MSNLNFAPGESEASHESFSPSVVLFWLKTEVGVSDSRIVTKEPNTVLGLIPLGYSDGAFPLANVASVGVDSKFSVSRLIFGLISLVIGLSTMGSAAIVGLFFFLLGISMLANVMGTSLKIMNNGGGVSFITVSILEKSKVERFREKINQQLFANHASIRHAESMRVQNDQLHVQQQQLNAQIMQQQQYQEKLPPLPPTVT